MANLLALSENSVVSLGLVIVLIGVMSRGVWILSDLHGDVDGLKRVAVSQMSSRWRCDPQMKKWVEQTERLNGDVGWMGAPIVCEDDRDILNFSGYEN